MGFKIKIKKPKIKLPKVVNSAVKSVTKPLGSGLTKLTKGDFKGGLGDLSSGAVSMGLNVATGGNKGVVNGLSGGLLDSVEGVARGNSKDIVRTGVTGGAAFFGGPMTAMAVNQKFASGQSAESAIASGLTSEGNMGLSDLLNPTNPLGNLATSYLTGLANNASKPKPLKVVQTAPAAAPQVSVAGPSMDYKKMAIYGGAGLAVLAIVAMLLKRK